MFNPIPYLKKVNTQMIIKQHHTELNQLNYITENII